MPTRREFFRRAAALPASWTAFQAALRAAPEPDERYWALVKRQFPLEDGIVYLNAANICPASRPVTDRYLEFARDFHANPSFQNREKYAPIREAARAKTARMLRVSADEIAITRNTSESNNIVITGLDLKAGDEVLITAHNHPSNKEAWEVRARRQGFTVKTLPTPVPARSAEELIAGFERAITPRTRAISFTHVTNTAGALYPAREISAVGRRRGIFVHLDGAQTFAALDVNLARIGCDSYAGSAHKWLMGPLEAGILYVRAEQIPRVWPSVVGAGWRDDLKGARRFEALGQRDDPRMAALEAALDFIELIGMERVEARMRALAARAMRELREIPGLELMTSPDPALSGGIVRFRPPGTPTKQVYDALWKRHRVAAAMTGSGDSEGLRFSPHIYNSPEEIGLAVAALRG
jgi:isopenicillin-N epimerase